MSTVDEHIWCKREVEDTNVEDNQKRAKDTNSQRRNPKEKETSREGLKLGTGRRKELHVCEGPVEEVRISKIMGCKRLLRFWKQRSDVVRRVEDWVYS